MNFERHQDPIDSLRIGRLSDVNPSEFKSGKYSIEDLKKILESMKSNRIKINGKEYSECSQGGKIDYWNTTVKAIKQFKRDDAKQAVKDLGNIYYEDLVKFSFKDKEFIGKAWSSYLYKDGRVKVDAKGRMEFRVEQENGKIMRYIIHVENIIEIIGRTNS